MADKKFLSDEEMASLEKSGKVIYPKFMTDEEMMNKMLEKPTERYPWDITKEGTKEAFIEAIPMALGTAGSVAGGILAGPPGAVGGGVLGGTAGGYIKQMIRPPQMKETGFLERQLELAKEPVKEGLLVGIGESAGPAIGGVAKSVAPKIKEYANLRAVKTLGGLKKAFDKLEEKNIVQPLGEQLLEDKIVTPLSRPKEIAKKLEGRLGELEGQLSQEISAAEFGKEIAKQSGLSKEEIKAIENTAFKPKQVAENLKEKIASEYKFASKEKLQPAFDEIDSWLQHQPEVMNISDVQAFKREFNKFLNESDFYKSNPGFKKQGMLAVRKALMKNVEDQANIIAETLGGKSGQVKEINKKLGNYINALDIAEDAIARQSAHRGVSLTDTVAGAGAASAGHTPIEKGMYAAVIAAANKFGRTFGSGILATGSNKLSKDIIRAGGLLEKQGAGSFLLNKPAKAIGEELTDIEKLALEKYLKKDKENER